MKNVILDVDTGIDDALAIAYGVKSEKLNILGITTCFGNVSVEEATRNTLQVLEVIGASQIPVIKGEHQPMERKPLKGDAKHVHGENGLGGVALPYPMTPPNHQTAVDYLLETFKKYPGEITYIALGSLTNLALAIKKEPEIVQYIERVVVMGGAVTVPGNTNPHAEANIYTDPEAANFVFQSRVPLTLVGLDVTMQTLLKRQEIEKWREKKTKSLTFLADMTEFYMDFYMKVNRLDGCALHDPLAVGVAIDPTFVKSEAMNIQVETDGDQIGKTYITEALGPKIDVCLEVEKNRFTEHFIKVVGS